MRQVEFTEAGARRMAEHAQGMPSRADAIDYLKGFTMRQLAEIGAQLGSTVLHPKREMRILNLADLACGRRLDGAAITRNVNG
jgi:hypothetical protein